MKPLIGVEYVPIKKIVPIYCTITYIIIAESHALNWNKLIFLEQYVGTCFVPIIYFICKSNFILLINKIKKTNN